MTRSSLNHRLRAIYLICGLVLLISLAARVAPQLPGLEGTRLAKLAPPVYDFMRDMALVFVTMVAAYLANVFQKRSKFVASLEEEWRAMVRTKTELVTFCQRDPTTLDDYLTAYGRISAALDNMRIVYRNVGETDDLIGLYPYAPLHDMRRALETLDPRNPVALPPAQREVVCQAILQSFYALRETFLEELDLEEPTHGLLISGARRMKRSGATRGARRQQARQQRAQQQRGQHGNGLPAGDDNVTMLLAEAYARESERGGDRR